MGVSVSWEQRHHDHAVTSDRAGSVASYGWAVWRSGWTAHRCCQRLRARAAGGLCRRGADLDCRRPLPAGCRSGVRRSLAGARRLVTDSYNVSIPDHELDLLSNTVDAAVGLANAGRVAAGSGELPYGLRLLPRPHFPELIQSARSEPRDAPTCRNNLCGKRATHARSGYTSPDRSRSPDTALRLGSPSSPR